MMKTLAIAASLLLAACLETTESDPVDTDGDGAGTPIILARDNGGVAGDHNRDICSKLPDDAGACSVACDPDAVMAFIPEDSCAVIRCTLTDGTTFSTGGCN